MDFDQSQQLMLGMVLAAMMFGVALELKLAHFQYVLGKPLPVLIGLVCQCLLLPWLTLLATLYLDLRPGLALGMMLVACCPGGNLSNIITHLARGNTALSVSVTSMSSLLAIISLPLNFALISSLNPQTAAFLHSEMGALNVDPSGIVIGLLLMLVLPLIGGMLVGNIFPRFTQLILPLFKRLSMSAFGLFLGIALYSNWDMLVSHVGLIFLLVVGQNAAALGLGWSAARLFGLADGDRRALTIEVGMQNSGLALGLILTQFGAEPDMALIAALWGTWHIISGLMLVFIWRHHKPSMPKEQFA